jgi:serine/threonine protein kinase
MESNIGSYIIGKTIGEGTFGRVKLGVHKETNQLVIESYSIYL